MDALWLQKEQRHSALPFVHSQILGAFADHQIIEDAVYVKPRSRCYRLFVALRSSRTEGEVFNLKGPRIRLLREQLGISQAELARRLQLNGWDVDIMVLNRVELGKRSLTDIEIQKVLDTLGKKWADLDE